MDVSEIVNNFLSLTQDAVSIGYRGPEDDNARLLYVNQSFLDLFGYAEDDVIGHTVRMYHDPDNWDDYVASVKPKFEAGETRFGAEARCIRADGSKFWASLSLFVIDDPANGGRYSGAVFRDISDLKAREEAAAAALEERERLVQKQDDMYRELLATQTRMFAAINAYPAPFAIFDKGLNLINCNTAYQRSMSAKPELIQPDMNMRAILHVAFNTNRMILPPGMSRTEWINELLSPESLAEPVQDLEFADDTHHRVLRSEAENGDLVVIRLDTTELVRQQRSARAAEARLLAAIRGYPAPFCIYDSNNRLVVWNDSYTRSLTDTSSELRVGMTLEEVMHIGLRNHRFIDAIGREQAWLADMLRSADTVREVEDIELADDTHHRVLRSRSSNGDLVIVRLDTTELVRQRRTLQETQDRLISSINAFPDPFAIYDSDYNLVVWNPAFASSLTDDPDLLQVGTNIRQVMEIAVENDLIPQAKGREREWVNDYVASDLAARKVEDIEYANDQHFRIIRSRAENGEILVLRLNITETVQQRRALERYALQLEKANREITHKALHDQLTGLGNRRYLEKKFAHLSIRRAQSGGDMAALHIDLDRFKQINDTIGHPAGDHVLKVAAKRILETVRRDDIVGRIGGDEFLILLRLPEGSDRARQLAQDLIERLSEPTIFEGRECRFGASIGIAQTPLAEEADLLTHSDVALYKAKRAGRGQVGIFDRSDIIEMRRTKRIADEIMRGLENSEFVPFYQPQIDAQSGAVVGLEALARWQHPNEGLLPPDEFLSVASDLNVVADIDRMIFEKAINETSGTLDWLGYWPSLSFNISANRIQFDDLDRIGHYARAYPGQVVFELLETIFLEEESDAFLMQLDQLRDLGISLEVDDFGSGRASVIALQRIAPDHLKIDRRLVSPIAPGNAAAQLVQSIIDIGHALDIRVIAEGVETAQQVDLLAEMGAARLQGFFFAKPLDVTDLCKFIRTYRPFPKGRAAQS